MATCGAGDMTTALFLYAFPIETIGKASGSPLHVLTWVKKQIGDPSKSEAFLSGFSAQFVFFSVFILGRALIFHFSFFLVFHFSFFIFILLKHKVLLLLSLQNRLSFSFLFLS